MRLAITLFGIVAIALPPMAATEESQAQKDFDLGGMVEACLSVKCQVFRGTILTETPKAGEPITVAVDEALYGMPEVPKSVAVPYDKFHDGSNDDRIASAWSGTKLSARSQVTVVTALEPTFGLIDPRPGLLLVTSDEHAAGIVRLLTEEALRLSGAPDLISVELTLLSNRQNPAALAGYFYSYLVYSRRVQKRDLRVHLLTQMIGNPSVPDDMWYRTADELILFSNGLSASGNGALIQSLTDLAQRSDVRIALAGLHGLAGLSTHGLSIRFPAIAPALMPKLVGAYRVQARRQRDPVLEAQLGIEMPAAKK